MQMIKSLSDIALILLILPILINAFNIKSHTARPPVSYPVRFGYIDRLSSWSNYKNIAAGMGVPGYAPPHIYNYICLAFWTHMRGPLDIVKLWSEPTSYIGTASPFGKTKDEIQKSLKKIYNDNGIKIMISAFGATEFPTSKGYNAITVAT
jgi:hypothetical protein